MRGRGASPRLLSPVGPHELVSMGLQEKPSQHVLHAAANVALGDAPQPGVHAQGLTACHVVQEGIELRAVPDPLLDLGARGTQQGLAHRQVSARKCPSQEVLCCTSARFLLKVMGTELQLRNRR